MLPKLTRGTLADQVTERLLEYIDSNKLKPGELLPSETSLGNSFGVSRPVIREALKNLEGKGVLEIVNGKGAMIRPIDSDPLRQFFQRAMKFEQNIIIELMEIRRGLEVQAVELAAQRRTTQDLELIHCAVKAMRSNMNNLDNYTRLDVEFHLLITAASHNAMLGYLVESIRDALHSTIRAGLQSRGTGLNIETIQQTHEELLRRLELGDSEGALRIMQLHFDEAISAIKQVAP